jgi:hypothetical protein
MEFTVKLMASFHRDWKEASIKKSGPRKFVQMALLRNALLGP